MSTYLQKPEDQSAFPLIKWVYGLQISFPGGILDTKPASPPPTPEELKAQADKATKGVPEAVRNFVTNIKLNTRQVSSKSS